MHRVESLTLDLDMNIVECALGNFASAVALGMDVVVLFNSYVVTRDSSNPGYMAGRSTIALCDTSGDGLVVNTNASFACGFVPGIRIAPISAFVLVGKVNSEAIVDAPGDKAGTLTLKVVPLV